jgi:hypothetical protein
LSPRIRRFLEDAITSLVGCRHNQAAVASPE